MSNLTVNEFSPDQVALIKREIAQGCTDDELAMFLHHAQKSGLDPLARQIYMIRRRQYDSKSGGYIERASIQVGIDGFRVIADRTGAYAPGEEKFDYNDKGDLIAAHVSVKKLVAGTWHEVWTSAYWDEYAQIGKDGKPTHMWAKLGRVMLAKTAEAKCLRRCFPAQLSGLYTPDEMAQAEKPKVEHKHEEVKNLPIAANIPMCGDLPGGSAADDLPPLKPRTEDKLAKLSKEQQEVYTSLAAQLITLQLKDKDLEDALEMASEFRDPETNEVPANKKGARSLDWLNYSRAGRAPKSQAEFCLGNLMKLESPEKTKIALEVWRAS